MQISHNPFVPQTLTAPFSQGLPDELFADPPLSVAPETPLIEVLAMMNQKRINSCVLDTRSYISWNVASSPSCALIVEAGKIEGIITERDVVRLIASGGNLAHIKVAEVMTSPVRLLERQKIRDLFTILSVFRQFQVRHLPIVDDRGTAIAVVTSEMVRQVLQPANFLQLQEVRDVMNATVVQAVSGSSVLEIAQLMARSQVSCVAIVESVGEGDRTPVIPIGIITEGDILQMQVLQLDLANTPVQQVMSAPIFCISPDETLWVALQMMQQRGVGRLVVAGKAGELQGILTQTSLLQTLNPIEMYRIIEMLQTSVSQLQAEKVQLQSRSKKELEKQVRERTAHQMKLIGSLQAKREQERILSQIALSIRQSLNLDEILRETVTEVRQFLKSDRVLVYQFDPTMDGTIVAESVAPNCPSVFGVKIADTCFQENGGKDYLNGRKQVICNIYEAGLTPCHLHLLERFHVCANLVVPIAIDRNREVHWTRESNWCQTTCDPSESRQLWGLLIAHQCWQPRQWQDSELDLLDKLSVQIAIAIQQAGLFQQIQTELVERQQAEAQLQQLNQELENRVKGRTLELEKTVDRLQQEVLERQQAQKELNLVKERLQYLLSSSPTVIYSCETQGSYGATFVSDNLTRLTGYHPQQFLEDRNFWADRIHPEDADRVFTELQQLFGKGIHSYEYRFLHANGSYIWVRDDLRLIKDASGQPLEIVGSTIDITDRKVAEQAVQEREAQLRDFFDNANDLIQSISAEGQFLYVNQAWCHTLGYSNAEIDRLSFFDILAIEERDRFQSVLKELTAYPQSIRLGLTFINKKGRRILVEGNLNSRTQNGKLVEIRGIFRDITERKQAEQALTQQTELLKTVFDNIPIYVLFYDKTGRLLLINREFRKKVGWSIFDVINRNSLRNCYPDPGQRKRMNAMVQFTTGEWEDFQIQACNGEVLETSWTSIQLSDGSSIAIGQDVTHRKQTEAALRHSEELFRSTFKLATVGLIHSSVTGNLLRFNDKFCTILGYSPEELLDKNVFDITYADDVAIGQEYMQQILAGYINECYFEKRYCCKDGTLVWVKITASLVRKASGDPDYFIAAVEDISDRKQSQAELEKRELYLTGLVEVQRQLLNSTVDSKLYDLILNILGTVSEASRVYLFENHRDDRGKFVTSQKAEWCAPGISSQANNPDLQNFPYEEFYPRITRSLAKGEILEGIVAEFSESEREILEPQGILAILLLPLIVNGEFCGFIGFDNCIEARAWEPLEVSLLSSAAAAIALAKERHLTQQALQRQLAAVEAATDGIAILDEKSEYIYVNSAHTTLFGYDDASQMLGKTWYELYYPETVKQLESEVFPLLIRDRHWSGEAIAKRRNGSTFDEELSLTLTAGGGLVCVCRDITQRKQAEAKIKASLREKEVLLKEIHHRVKNNLQIVHSLLKLQSNYTKDAHTLQMFRDSQNRIRSMALIHELLYQSDNLGSINFAEYIQNLTTNLLRVYNVSASQVCVQLNLEPIELGLDTAIPCGLAINELMTNALKYAFPGDLTGTITIDFHKQAEDLYWLKIGDNGVGFPEGIDSNTTESLGLKLVYSLTSQLDGKIHLDRERGTHFTLEFSELKYKSRG